MDIKKNNSKAITLAVKGEKIIKKAELSRKLITKPATIWITGLSASGKTTSGQQLAKNLNMKGVHNVVFLDGENLRKNLDRVYGYTTEERYEVLLNTIRIATEHNKQGDIVIVSTISHQRKIRDKARKAIKHFMEVYLKCPVEICAQRDYKGHYKKAFEGEIDNYIGVAEPYETSTNPELIIDTAHLSIDECSSYLLEHVLDFLTI